MTRRTAYRSRPSDPDRRYRSGDARSESSYVRAGKSRGVPAADGRHRAGSFTRIDYAASPPRLRAKAPCGTHTLGVEAGLELARTLGALPGNVWIYVIFGREFDRGLEMGQAVRGGVARLVERIENDVRAFVEALSCTS